MAPSLTSQDKRSDIAIKRAMALLRFALACLLVLPVGALVVGWCDTALYVVKPTSVSSVAATAEMGSAFDAATRTLSVVSDAPVIVVADRGKSFKYVVTWIVPEARAQPTAPRSSYQFTLSEYAREEHIHPLGSDVPLEIQKVAQKKSWFGLATR